MWLSTILLKRYNVDITVVVLDYECYPGYTELAEVFNIGGTNGMQYLINDSL